MALGESKHLLGLLEGESQHLLSLIVGKVQQLLGRGSSGKVRIGYHFDVFGHF